jgi:hypothetical protein
MQFHIMTDKDSVTVYADIVKIEVEDIIGPSEDDIDDHCYRAIRFTKYDGQSILVTCHASDTKDLRLHRVKVLKPVKKPKLVSWLDPVLYEPEKE